MTELRAFGMSVGSATRGAAALDATLARFGRGMGSISYRELRGRVSLVNSMGRPSVVVTAFVHQLRATSTNAH